MRTFACLETPTSILSDLLKKRVTFNQAATAAAAWAQSLITHYASLTSSAAATLSDIKQGASNAVEAADSALAAHCDGIVTGTEALLKGTLAKATGGVSVPFNPFISDGSDRLAAAVKAQADAWVLQAKAKLASAGAPAGT